ncbi:MAG: RHS repeat-associated core domain-containing protein, partial [Longimicrobiaceae bacterium]
WLQPIWLGYDGASARVSQRVGRRGYRTDFRYDAAYRLSAAKRWMDVAATGDSIVVRFRAQESQGLLATGGSVADAQLYTRLDGPRQDVGDTTTFVLGRWGSPAKITDALGHVTTLSRADPRWPGLVTRVVYPNGRELTATYDARGHLAASVDWANPRAGSYATTLYAWDDFWDAPTKVTQPEGEFTLTAYDAYGRPAWIQPGPDSARRTRFAYHPTSDPNAAGLVQSVTSPLTAAESYGYDALGNLSAATSPAGLRTSTYANAYGRVDSIVAPDSIRKRLTYDGADRLVEEESFGPSRTARASFAADSSYAPEHVWVHTYRNADGQPDSVSRWQSPDPASIGVVTTRWRYDGAGRTVVEIAPDATPATLADNPRDSTVYDRAGNPTDVFTRRGYHVEMRYDTLGRLAMRITPEATTPPIAPVTISNLQPQAFYFPYFGQDAAGNFTLGTAQQARPVTIPADTARFTYDAMGNVLSANNRDARISRSWNDNGTLASETQRIRTYAGNDTTAHTYRLDYGYDLDGRRTALIHPSTISPHAPARDTTRYGYDPFTGDLATIAGQGGYTFEYDVAGRVRRLGRVTTHETFGFDAAGRMAAREEWRGSTQLHGDLITFDPATGEMERVNALRETVLQARRPLGALGWVDTYNTEKGTRNVESYRTDPMANQISMRVEAYATGQTLPSPEPEEAVHGYQAGTGRQVSTANASSAGAFEVSVYDAAGNQTFRAGTRVVTTPYTIGTTTNATAKLREEAAMYYGADDRLRVADRRSCLYFADSPTSSTCDTTKPPPYEKRSAFEEYRYDALGRRVLVRTRSEFACQLRCLNTLRRTVWDGDQVLYEISAPGASGATAAQMEADTGLAVPLFNANGGVTAFFPYGRVMYEHGAGIDAPLGVVRMEYSDKLHGPQVILPHADWRGTYDRGTTLGSCFVYGTNGQFLAPPPDSTPNNGDGTRIVGGQYDGSAQHCISVDWPAAYTWSARQYRRGYDGPISWMGSLIYESRDASGLYYRRNRYYDSEKSRFTQEDPIGLAGGVNAYEFAEGDPLSYGDAFGLAADSVKFTGQDDGEWARRVWEALKEAASIARASTNQNVATSGLFLFSLMEEAENSSTTTWEVNAHAYD